MTGENQRVQVLDFFTRLVQRVAPKHYLPGSPGGHRHAPLLRELLRRQRVLRRQSSAVDDAKQWATDSAEVAATLNERLSSRVHAVDDVEARCHLTHPHVQADCFLTVTGCTRMAYGLDTSTAH